MARQRVTQCALQCQVKPAFCGVESSTTIQRRPLTTRVWRSLLRPMCAHSISTAKTPWVWKRPELFAPMAARCETNPSPQKCFSARSRELLEERPPLRIAARHPRHANPPAPAALAPRSDVPSVPYTSPSRAPVANVKPIFSSMRVVDTSWLRLPACADSIAHWRFHALPNSTRTRHQCFYSVRKPRKDFPNQAMFSLNSCKLFIGCSAPLTHMSLNRCGSLRCSSLSFVS